MANKRLLKKQIKYICGDIAGECIMSRYLIPGIDAEKMESIVLEVATLQAATLKRVTFDFDKCKKILPQTKITTLLATNTLPQLIKHCLKISMQVSKLS